MSNSLQPCGKAHRLLCPWDSPGKNTEVGCYAFLQGIFFTQGLSLILLHLLHWQAGSLLVESSEMPNFMFVSSKTLPVNDNMGPKHSLGKMDERLCLCKSSDVTGANLSTIRQGPWVLLNGSALPWSCFGLFFCSRLKLVKAVKSCARVIYKKETWCVSCCPSPARVERIL